MDEVTKSCEHCGSEREPGRRFCSSLCYDDFRRLDPADERRVCRTCGTEKPIGEFATERGIAKSWCRPCKNAYYRDYVKARPGSERKRMLKSRYGVTEDRRSDPCDICAGRPENGLSVDHDHVTGQVRGWLCQPCNLALGLLRDDSERLRRAVVYLEGGQ